jgi:hypothetical protein
MVARAEATGARDKRAEMTAAETEEPPAGNAEGSISMGLRMRTNLPRKLNSFSVESQRRKVLGVFNQRMRLRVQEAESAGHRRLAQQLRNFQAVVNAQGGW